MFGILRHEQNGSVARDLGDEARATALLLVVVGLQVILVKARIAWYEVRSDQVQSGQWTDWVGIRMRFNKQ
jgi:hypothetical protein